MKYCRAKWETIFGREAVQITFTIDRSAGAPARYLQVAEYIATAIESGEYQPGDRLPTESQLLHLTGLSRGTIKEAYHYLQQQDIVTKVRGSGVYVQERMERTHQPRQVVDRLLDTLTHRHGMTLSDAHRLVQEQVAEAFASDHLLHVTVVDCNEETIHAIEKQLEQVPGLRISSVLHDELLLGGDAVIDPQCQLVLSTQLHYPGVCRYTEPLNLPTEPFALRESTETLAALSQLPENQPICVVYRSAAFLSSVRYTLRLISWSGQIIPCQEEDREELERRCQSGLPFLLPPDYMTYSSSRTLQCIYRARSAGSIIIPMDFEIDQGSILHIADLTKKMRSQPRRRYP